MNTAWTVEFTRIVTLVGLVLIAGFFSKQWLPVVFIASVAYIAWTLIQIRSFERWIRLGAKTHLAPDTSGIWELIVQHIHRSQKKNSHHKNRLNGLVKRFEATIAALPDATLVLNANLEIEWANRVAFELLGVDSKNDLGQRLDNLIRNPLLQNLFSQEGQALSNRIEMESPLDSNKTLIFSSVNFGDEQTLITARDVSQRLAVQKMRKAFVANASHELRTPLTVISGYLEMLEHDPEVPDELKKQVSNASYQAGRMQKILEDLLVLSKLEEKGYDKKSGERVNMPELLDKLVSDFKKTKAKNTHDIQLKVDQSLHVKAIESDVYSLCQNLLSNAIKYSPDDSVIKITWKMSDDRHLCLEVEDNGEGIAPENLSRLTERFYRVNVDRSRKVSGTGLGLSIVRHILENHGGYLDIRSELGKGSVFCSHFPSYRAIHR